MDFSDEDFSKKQKSKRKEKNIYFVKRISHFLSYYLRAGADHDPYPLFKIKYGKIIFCQAF